MNNTKHLNSWIREINYFRVILELIIVAAGVYLAFSIDQYQKDRAFEARRLKVFSILQQAAELYEKKFADRVLWHNSYNQEFSDKLAQGTIPYFGNFRYISPQYPVEAFNDALKTQNLDVYDLELYLTITEFSTGVSQLVYVEQKITDISEQYRKIADPGNAQLAADQKIIAEWFLQYMNDRKNVAGRLSKLAGKMRTKLGTILGAEQKPE